MFQHLWHTENLWPLLSSLWRTCALLKSTAVQQTLRGCDRLEHISHG
mgnify:CR=1 FL=1|jgi:hypothetical protein